MPSLNSNQSAVLPPALAIRDAANFLDVIKLAASKDVQATIARMEQLSSEAQERLSEAKQVESRNAADAGALKAQQKAIDDDRASLDGERAGVEREKREVEKDRSSARALLTTAESRAAAMTRNAEADESAAKALREAAEANAAEAKALRDAAAADRAEAARLKSEWEAKSQKLQQAIGA